MLRRSTGLSEEMKRVGISREKKCVSGDSKCRCVAAARSSVALEASVGSDDVVAFGGVLVAIERRRLVNGSADGSMIWDV